MWEKRAFQAGDELPGPDGRSLTIVRFLAEGGFSEVYEATCKEGTRYAVKALRPKHRGNQKTQERQRREAKALYLIKHPNVVRVRHIGVRTEDDLVYMVMELLVGRTLRELQRDFSAVQPDAADPNACGRLPVAWVLEIMKHACAGLEALHKYKVIHRDLKPENIFVCDDGRVLLLDIGTAFFQGQDRLTTNDVTIGTATYMSPEQLRATGGMDVRSDLFNIGIILYELFSGVHPFSISGVIVGDRMALALRIISEPHTPLRQVAKHLPDFIVGIVERLLRKDPSERYPSAPVVRNHLAAAHAAFLSSLGDLAPPALTEAIAKIPRASVNEEQRPSLPLPASTNPFVTVSVPPELVRSSLLPTVRHGAGKPRDTPAGAPASLVTPGRFAGAGEGEGDRAASTPELGKTSAGSAARTVGEVDGEGDRAASVPPEPGATSLGAGTRRAAAASQPPRVDSEVVPSGGGTAPLPAVGNAPATAPSRIVDPPLADTEKLPTGALAVSVPVLGDDEETVRKPSALASMALHAAVPTSTGPWRPGQRELAPARAAELVAKPRSARESAALAFQVRDVRASTPRAVARVGRAGAWLGGAVVVALALYGAMSGVKAVQGASSAETRSTPSASAEASPAPPRSLPTLEAESPPPREASSPSALAPQATALPSAPPAPTSRGVAATAATPGTASGKAAAPAPPQASPKPAEIVRPKKKDVWTYD